MWRGGTIEGYIPFKSEAISPCLLTSGLMFQGTIRNGRDVAVKVLSAESRQGVREFLTEIDVITNVKHPNLVELIGCCVEGNNRILVYEYLENSSLDRALLGMNIDMLQ